MKRENKIESTVNDLDSHGFSVLIDRMMKSPLELAGTVPKFDAILRISRKMFSEF